MKKLTIIILLLLFSLIIYSDISNLERAVEYEKMEDYKKSEKYFKLAADKDESPAAMLKMSIILENQGKKVESKEYFEKGMEKLAAMQFTEAAAKKFLEEDYEGAEKFYIQAIKLNDRNAMLYLGYLYLKQEKNEEAYKYIEMAAKRGQPSAKEILKKLKK